MKYCVCIVATFLPVFIAPMHAELPESMRATAAEFEQTMKSYDTAVAAKIKLERDNYLRVLGAARQQAERRKRTAQVTAIDRESATIEAGKPLAEKPSADLPPELATFRGRFLTATERAERSAAAPRKFSRTQYLKWLEQMATTARIGKNPELAKAVADEKERVIKKYPIALDAEKESEKKPKKDSKTQPNE